MNKISFPKGSLQYKRIPSKEVPLPNYKDYSQRKFINVMFEKEFPHEMKEELPADILDMLANNRDNIKYWRNQIKDLPSHTINHSYEITFKHPKWSKVIGAITIKSEKKNISETMKLIAETFKQKKNEFRKGRSRVKEVTIKSYGNTRIRYNISGGCIYMPELREGVYLNFLKVQERKIVFSDKQPKDSENKYVGIEMEFLCAIDKDALGNKLFDLGLGRYVTVKEDHSIKCSHGQNPYDCREHAGKEHAHELCVIAKESEYVEIVGKICKLLSELKATVNKTCGMHVHLDCRSRDPEKVYQNLISSQNILLRMNPKSRIETYSKVNKERDFELAKTRGGAGAGGRIDEGRYYAINAKAYEKHKTIEVRVHAGTVDFKKITNWVSILVNIANCKDRYQRSFATINTFCKKFGIETDVQTYIQDRIDKFKIKVEGGNEVAPEAERGVA